MEAFYKSKPSLNAFQKQGGEVAVCIDWTETKVQRGDVTVDGYLCTEIDFRPTMLDSDHVIESFIREKYSESAEMALINAYQASVSGIAKDAEKEAEYLNFLKWRESMKAQVKSALSTYESTIKEESTDTTTESTTKTTEE